MRIGCSMIAQPRYSTNEATWVISLHDCCCMLYLIQRHHETASGATTININKLKTTMTMKKSDAVFLPRIRSSQRRKPFQLKPRRDLIMAVNKTGLDNRRTTLLQLLRIQLTQFEASKNDARAREFKDQNETVSASPAYPLCCRSSENSQHSGATHTVAEFPKSSYHTPEQEKRIPASIASPPLISRHPLPVLEKRESTNIPDHLLMPLLI